MISRKKILSRSQSDIEYPYDSYECDDDIWYNKDKLYAVSFIDKFFFLPFLVRKLSFNW